MTKSDKDELTMSQKLRSAAWVLDKFGYPVSAREVREAADLLAVKTSGPVNIVGALSDDFTTFHSSKLGENFNVDDTLTDLDSIQAELDGEAWIHSGRSVRGAAELIRHLLVTVSTLSVNRKGMDLDFKGMEAELKEARKTITELQTAGEKADIEIDELKSKLSSAEDDMTDQLVVNGELAETVMNLSRVLSNSLKS